MKTFDLVQGKRITDEIKKMLWLKAGPDITNQGYLPSIESNLIPGVHPHQFLGDMENGAGQELKWKFRAVHSSSALTVNNFAPFKDHPAHLMLLGREGFEPPTFEKKLPTGLGGTPPTLDVWLQLGREGWAIESKFLEYFTPKRALFSTSYTRRALPWAEDCWWQVLEDSQKGGKRHLDIAQLVKHYFGLSRLLLQEKEVTSGILLYLFWEPENGLEIDVCHRHREELQEFSGQVADSAVAFRWMSYSELWREWEKLPTSAEHVKNLRARYRVQL